MALLRLDVPSLNNCPARRNGFSRTADLLVVTARVIRAVRPPWDIVKDLRAEGAIYADGRKVFERGRFVGV